MVGRFPKQNVNLCVQRYDVTAKSTSANLLYKKNQNRDLLYFIGIF